MSHKSYRLDVIIACVVLNCILCIVLITCDTIINAYLLTLLVESDNVRCINIQNVGQTCESGRNCYIKTATYRDFEKQKLVCYCIFATLVLISTSVCKFSGDCTSRFYSKSKNKTVIMQLAPVYSISLFTFNFSQPLPEPAYTWTTPDYRCLENRPRETELFRLTRAQKLSFFSNLS